MFDTRKVVEAMEAVVVNLSISFRTHNTHLLTKVKRDSAILEQIISNVSNKQYLDYIEAARQNLDKVVLAVENKVTGGVLFSETAAREMHKLFEGQIDFINHLKDYLLTKNKVLHRHILDEAEKYTRYARDCATKHEERLIQGICQPRSSTYYLDMLNGISGIFYNLSRLTG